MTRNETFIAILKDQVVPALGCTEPGAVAYAVARAHELLGSDDVESMLVYADKNILKNALGVGIPGTPERGLAFACALSLLIGKAEYVLEVLKDVTPESIVNARKLVDDGKVDIHLAEEAPGLYIDVTLKAADGKTSRVKIEGTHTNITYEEADGKVLKDTGNVGCDDVSYEGEGGVRELIRNYKVDDMIDFANEVPAEDIAFMQDGIEMNMTIAQSAIDGGMAICTSMMNKAKDIYDKAQAYTAAGSEARMSGSPLPVMSSAGSGNHGMTAIVPINVIATGLGIDGEKIRRAVALSHLVTNYIKVYLGPLSPICGCGVAAGIGAAAGLTYVRGGSREQIKMAISNMSAGISGMFCDGAKLGCSIKVAVAARCAIDASNLALDNVEIPGDNGILGSTPEQTMQNIAEVSVVGMDKTDFTILKIMQENK